MPRAVHLLINTWRVLADFAYCRMQDEIARRIYIHAVRAFDRESDLAGIGSRSHIEVVFEVAFEIGHNRPLDAGFNAVNEK